VANGSPLQKFVIFGIGRCGSSVLVDLLNSQPLVWCDFYISEPVPDPYAKMQSRAAQVAESGVSAFGVRLLVPHLVSQDSEADVSNLLARIREDGWTIIHTRRSSLLRTAISYVHAGRHGFHLRHEDGPWQFEPMVIDLTEFSEWLTLVIDWAQIERRALVGTRYYEIVYEDDLAAEGAQWKTITRLMDHLLGVQASPARTAFRRQLPTGDLPDLVVNYAEIMSFLGENGLTELVTG
jgi:LPS sulfotransferase NodH